MENCELCDGTGRVNEGIYDQNGGMIDTIEKKCICKIEYESENNNN